MRAPAVISPLPEKRPESRAIEEISWPRKGDTGLQNGLPKSLIGVLDDPYLYSPSGSAAAREDRCAGTILRFPVSNGGWSPEVEAKDTGAGDWV